MAKNKEKKVEKETNFTDRAPIRNHLLAYLLDMLMLVLTTVGLYYAALYGVCAPAFGYVNKSNRIKEIENQYNLNLTNKNEWYEYEEVVKNFYLTFADQIVAGNKEKTGEDASIIHIYNVTVLELPSKPTDANYKTSYYQYKKDETGFLVDEWAERIEGNSTYYFTNLRGIFETEYNHLFNYLKIYNSEYLSLTDSVYYQKNITRASVMTINVIVIFIVIPLFSKKKQTLFENMFHIARVNKKDSLLIKNHKVVLRPIILYLLPIVGVFFMNRYSFIILAIAPLFINILVSFFSKNNQDVVELLLTDVAIDTDIFPVATTKEELDLLIGKVELSDDAEYTDRLSNIEPLDIKNK